MSKNPLFLVAAIFNWVIGAVFVAAPDLVYAYGLGAPTPENLTVLYLFALLVILFGVGYFWGYRDLNANRQVIKLGAIGKTLVFLTVAVLYFMGQATALLAAVAAADLAFAAAFMAAIQRNATVEDAM